MKDPHTVFLACLLFAGDVCLGQRGQEDRSAPRAEEPLVFERDVEQAIGSARARKMPYFLDFETTWCAPCRRMNELVYTAASVADAAHGLVLIKIDGDERPDLTRRHRVRGYPSGILFASDGRELARFSGYRSVKQMTAFFRQAPRQAPRSAKPAPVAGEARGGGLAPLPWVQGAIRLWLVGSPPGGDASAELLDFQLDAELAGFQVEIVTFAAEELTQALLDAVADGAAPDLLLVYDLDGELPGWPPGGGSQERVRENLVDVSGAFVYGRQFLVSTVRSADDRAGSWIAERFAIAGRE